MFRIHIDLGLFAVTLALAGLSLALIWSTNPGYFLPQLIFFLFGFLVFFIVSSLDREVFRALAKTFYLLSVLILIITLLNTQIRGASRWINIFGFYLQPAEFVKPLMIISFSYFLAERKINSIFSFAKLLGIYILPLLIIFLQPDLGNFIIYLLFLIGLLFANRLDLKIFIFFVLFITIASPLAWHVLKPYQQERILSFINPQHDPYGSGYNAIQAMIAVGSGKLFGYGLGRGSQSHLRFLPENHTDFIFASLVEELGLFGAVLLLTFYGFILVSILRQASSSSDKFSYLILIGIFSQILAQIFINIAMNIGLIPITGVTLPLISSGGSSVLATFITLGIVQSLAREKKQAMLVIR